jgi:hypothetical protein
MERASMLVGKTMKAIASASIEARGLYFTMYLLACLKTDDDIESGTVEFWGTEATPETLAAHLKTTSESVEIRLKELETLGLVTLSPLTITSFAEDNQPFLAIRRSNRARKGTKYRKVSPEIQMDSIGNSGRERIGKDRIGQEGKGEDQLESPAKVKTFRVSELEPTFQDEFSELHLKVFGKKAVVFIVSEGEVYAKKYGKEKLFATMKEKAGGYWDWVKKELDNPRQKPKEAEPVKQSRLDCPECEKHTLINLTSSMDSWVCEECDYKETIPVDLEGIDLNYLSDNRQKILKQLRDREVIG